MSTKHERKLEDAQRLNPDQQHHQSTSSAKSASITASKASPEHQHKQPNASLICPSRTGQGACPGLQQDKDASKDKQSLASCQSQCKDKECYIHSEMLNNAFALENCNLMARFVLSELNKAYECRGIGQSADCIRALQRAERVYTRLTLIERDLIYPEMKRMAQERKTTKAAEAAAGADSEAKTAPSQGSKSSAKTPSPPASKKKDGTAHEDVCCCDGIMFGIESLYLEHTMMDNIFKLLGQAHKQLTTFTPPKEAGADAASAVHFHNIGVIHSDEFKALLLTLINMYQQHQKSENAIWSKLEPRQHLDGDLNEQIKTNMRQLFFSVPEHKPFTGASSVPSAVGRAFDKVVKFFSGSSSGENKDKEKEHKDNKNVNANKIHKEKEKEKKPESAKQLYGAPSTSHSALPQQQQQRQGHK